MTSKENETNMIKLCKINNIITGTKLHMLKKSNKVKSKSIFTLTAAPHLPLSSKNGTKKSGSGPKSVDMLSSCSSTLSVYDYIS